MKRLFLFLTVLVLLPGCSLFSTADLTPNQIASRIKLITREAVVFGLNQIDDIRDREYAALIMLRDARAVLDIVITTDASGILDISIARNVIDDMPAEYRGFVEVALNELSMRLDLSQINALLSPEQKSYLVAFLEGFIDGNAKILGTENATFTSRI